MGRKDFVAATNRHGDCSVGKNYGKPATLVNVRPPLQVNGIDQFVQFS